MNEFLLYVLNSGICLSVLYLLFRSLMRKESNFRLNRIVLISLVVISLVIPGMVLPHYVHKPVVVQILPFLEEYDDKIPEYNSVEETTPLKIDNNREKIDHRLSVSKKEIILYGYNIGCFISFLILIWSLFSIFMLYKKAEIKRMNGYKLVIVEQDIPAFSFTHIIFISRRDYEDYPDVIPAHEQEHIRLNHFYDLIFLEAVKIFQWFNPFIYRLIHDMKDIHEFQADYHTLTKGIDATKYQLLIIQKGVGPKRFALANSFNHCQIKNRIVMMNKLKPGKAWRWKVAIFLPMLALLLMAFGKKGENAPPEKEILTSVVSSPQDPVKQWTEADFKEFTVENMRGLFEKANRNYFPKNEIYIHIDGESKITVSAKQKVWNLDELSSLIQKLYYNDKTAGDGWIYYSEAGTQPNQIMIIGKDSKTLQSDYLKLLNSVANTVIMVRNHFSKERYGLSYQNLTVNQHTEIDKLIPMSIFLSNAKLKFTPPPPPPPPIYIDIKKRVSI